jgi:hypothetical protein
VRLTSCRAEVTALRRRTGGRILLSLSANAVSSPVDEEFSGCEGSIGTMLRRTPAAQEARRC